MWKEIGLEGIAEYKDPFSLFHEGAVALAENKEKANPITIGWGAIGTLWSKPMCTVYIHKSRYSKHIFDEADGFSVCFFPKKEDPIALRYFGTASGRDEDKIAKSGYRLAHEDGIPYLEEAELVILCKKVGETDFKADQVPEGRIRDWYAKDGVHSLYMGEIVKVLKKEEK